MRLAGGGGERERLGVRERDHQDVARRAVLDHHRDQAGGIEDEPAGDGHSRTSTPIARRRAFASGIRMSPKWKTEAASAALAPAANTSAM